jgi:thiosulfate dehydrogenase [quinone] large subunit
MATLQSVWRKVIGRVDFVDPPVAQFLFGNPYASVLWLAARLYLGWKWLDSGIDKLGNPAWMDTGAAVQGFWARAVVVPETGRPVVTYDWYRDFLQFMLDGGHYVWFAKLIAISEVAVGVALVLGLFVGISAFGGAFMNWNFMMAGTASTNPVMFALSILLFVAWKNAGWIGLDRFLLPLLGTPWQPGRVFRREGRDAPKGAAGAAGRT